MQGAETADRSDESDFNGAWFKNDDRVKAKKSIVICGITRGGTSFAASVFGRLGIPYARRGERDIGRRYEHRDLRAAFVAKDGEAIKRITAEFSEQYGVWAWKLPAIQREFDFVAELVPNPHFVIIFKEPLSVSARKTDIKGKETLRSLQQVMNVYQHMAKIALETEYPLMLISYDRAMSRMKSFLQDAAKYAGVDQYNAKKVIAGIREDGKRYFRSEPGSEDAPAPTPEEAAPSRGEKVKPGKNKARKNVPVSFL
jgi:hypothetical protein